MNWIDGILIAILLAMVIVGSKKGLIREFMATLVIFVAIIVSVNYIDNFAVWLNQQLDVSPLVSAILAFVILLAASYAAFKLLGLLFYKLADIKKVGKRDQMGGALVGFVRGWLAASFIVFLTFLMPMPDSYFVSFSESFFGPAIAKTIPVMFDNTSAVHPNTPTFMQQMEATLLNPEMSDTGNLTDDRQAVHQALRNLDLYFNPAP